MAFSCCKTSYHHLKDKPFGSEIKKTVLNISISDDGFVVDSGENSVVHEFSELVNNGYLRVCDPISHDAYKSMVIVTDNHTFVVADYWDVVTSNGMVNDTFASFEGFVITYVDNANVDGDVFPTAGLYMYMPAILGEENPDARATASWQTEIIQTLDPKYLPDNVGGGSLLLDIDWDNNVCSTAPEAILNAWDNGVAIIARSDSFEFRPADIQRTDDTFYYLSIVAVVVENGNANFHSQRINADGTIDNHFSGNVVLSSGK